MYTSGAPDTTDNWNYILDCAFGDLTALRELTATLAGILAAVDDGSFIDLTDTIVIGTRDGVEIVTSFRDAP